MIDRDSFPSASPECLAYLDLFDERMAFEHDASSLIVLEEPRVAPRHVLYMRDGDHRCFTPDQPLTTNEAKAAFAIAVRREIEALYANVVFVTTSGVAYFAEIEDPSRLQELTTNPSHQPLSSMRETEEVVLTCGEMRVRDQFIQRFWRVPILARGGDGVATQLGHFIRQDVITRWTDVHATGRCFYGSVLPCIK